MPIFAQLRNRLKSLTRAFSWPIVAHMDMHLQSRLHEELAHVQQQLAKTTPGNPAAHGFKGYSQCDEDGVIQAIASKLGLSEGVFVEIGCGDGRENNTHYLLYQGWRGVWIDGSASNIRFITTQIPPSRRLGVRRSFVDRENVLGVIREELARIDGGSSIDLLSVDIDGNDLAITQVLAAEYRPRILVVEYNAKFRPPVVANVAYDPAHVWTGDDYQGASLAAWAKALTPEYCLVACNVAGTNAFFVRSDLANVFGNHTVDQLYQPARYYLVALRSGHPPSLKFLANALREQSYPLPAPDKP